MGWYGDGGKCDVTAIANEYWLQVLDLSNWRVCVISAITAGNTDMLERFCKAGMSMDFVSEYEVRHFIHSYHHHHRRHHHHSRQLKYKPFQLAGAIYDTNPSDKSSFEVLLLLTYYADKVCSWPSHFHYNSHHYPIRLQNEVCEFLVELLRQCNISAQKVKQICLKIVTGSAYPITTSLQVAGMLEVKPAENSQVVMVMVTVKVLIFFRMPQKEF